MPSFFDEPNDECRALSARMFRRTIPKPNTDNEDDEELQNLVPTEGERKKATVLWLHWQYCTWRHLCWANLLLWIAVIVIGLTLVITWSIDQGVFLHVTVQSDIQDDLTIGSSCRYRPFWRTWKCQRCEFGKCHVLKPKRPCPSTRRNGWDFVPPRFFSQLSDDTESQQTRTMSFLGKFVYKDQPLCTVESCWDLSRCLRNATELTVYLHHSDLDLLERAMGSFRVPDLTIRRVDDYRDACLILVDPTTYNSHAELKSTDHWQNGQNTVIYNLAEMRYTDGSSVPGDVPFQLFHVGHAAVATWSLGTAHLRLGYDMTLPLPRKWGRSVPPGSVDIHRPRSYLLSFRGKFQTSRQQWYQHRWLASAYWEDAPDIVTDIECIRVSLLNPGHKTISRPYQLPSSSYDDILWNSTFGFAAGGSGFGSYRFGEILSTGGIPVVTNDFAPPLSPEIDWNDCIIRVSETRIIDLPRRLRQIKESEIRRRQERCWYLHNLVFGDREDSGKWYNNEVTTFTRVLEIWGICIRRATEMRTSLDRLGKET